ncbi:MAG: two-component regulator propeller domain-containing protein [Pseudomonadota bacterium]
MRLESFSASPDIVGGRIWLSWDYALDALETPADAPAVLLRRKRRDFDFPPLVPGDAYLVYDGAAFPPPPVPGALQVIDLPPEDTIEDGWRVQTDSISVATLVGPRATEIQRRKRSIFYDAGGAPVRVRETLLDAGALTPGDSYYYELDDGSAPDAEAIARYRRIAAPGGTYGLNLTMHGMLPENLKTHDSRTLAPAFAFSGIPEASSTGGQLRRFIDMFGMGADALRSSAERLGALRDPQNVAAGLLAPLGDMIGWETASTIPIARQRNELQTAPRLFDVVGTVPALAALVTHQTGWRAQVAEFAQSVMRANTTPRRNLYLRRLDGSVWRGADDAAPMFAFPVGQINGSGGFPAQLVSGAVEPFALRAGLELTIIVDDGVPARVRFGPDDFVDIGAASAAEVAAVIAAAFDTIDARAVAGAVELVTVATGPLAALEIAPADTSLLALNDAPDGPVGAFADPQGRLRIVYEQRVAQGEGMTAAGETRPRVDRAITIKSFAYGSWRGEVALPDWTGAASSPGSALLGDGRIAVAWIDADRPTGSRLRMAAGAAAAATPASIAGRKTGPFSLIGGSRITFTGAFGSQVFTVQPADYVALAAATAIEVTAAINTQCPALNATIAAGGGIRIATVATGDSARLAIDLTASTAARALSLADRQLSGRGAWSAAIDWPGPLDGPATARDVIDPALCADPLGGARLFWSEHMDARWQVRQAHWSDRLTLVTAQGVSQQTGGAPWVSWHMADGLPSNVVRAVAADARGALWFATDAGVAERRADGVWTVFNTGSGLGSNDIRDVTLLLDGSLWAATPAGISRRTAAGVISVIAAAPGSLIGNDVQAVAGDAAGNAWAATLAGVSRLDPLGRWRSWTVTDGLPAGVPRRIATGAAGRVALAASDGVAIFADDAWRTFTTNDGLLSDDARSVAWSSDGTLYAVTAAGLERWDGNRWRARTLADGLPAADLRSIAALPDGRLAIGTANGLVVGAPDAPAGDWSVATLADGIAGPVIAGVHGGWSAPVTLAQNGGGDREARAFVGAGGRTWLFWSRREAVAGAERESWTLRLRRYDPATAAWNAESAMTAPPPNGAADRQPAPLPSGAGCTLFFTSDRSGGAAIWRVDVSGAGVAGAPAPVAADAAELTRPVAVAVPAGPTWLIHRSDAPLALAQVAVVPEPGTAPRRSERVPEVRALTLNAGARTPVLAHAARNLGRRRWGDYFAYTPEYPDVIDADAPTQTHVYTRRTIGLYLRQSPIGAAITTEAIARLRQLLRRHLPINLRLVLVVAPDPLVEYLYTADADIEEKWSDDIPFVETLGGLSDSSTVTIPGLGILIANDLDSRAFAATILATLKRRTWFPDLI